MKSKNKIWFIIFFTSICCYFCFPIGVLNAQVNNGFSEVIEKRTRNTKTFSDGQGNFQLQSTAGSFHFLNEQNNWEDIQSELSISGEENAVGLFRTDLPIVCDLATGQMNYTLQKDGPSMQLALNSTLEVWNENQIPMFSQPANISYSDIEVSGKNLAIRDIYSGIDRLQRFDYFQVANDFVIQNRPQNLPENGFLVFTETWQLPQGYELLEDAGSTTVNGWSGTLKVVNASGDVVSTISNPVFFDSAADSAPVEGEMHAATGTFVIARDGQRYIVSILVPESWLMREELVYPVTIDPTVSNTYNSIQGLQDWMTTFSTNCQATMGVTLPAGQPVVVTNTSTMYSILSKGTIIVSGFTTYYAAGFEQRSRIGYNGAYTPTQFGNGDSQSPQTVPYNIGSSSIANGCYPGGTVLNFVWQGYQVYFPDYSGPFQAQVAGCTTSYHNLVSNSWIVSVTYNTFQLNVIATPASPVICSGSPAGISLTSSPTGASFSYTATAFDASGQGSGNGNSIQQILNATNNIPGYVTYTITPTLNNCVGTPASVLVTVNPTYNMPVVNAQICNGQSYSFAGNTYTTAGLYSVTLQTAAGCDSIVNLNLNVVNTISSTVDEGVCDGDAYYFNGEYYDTPGTYTYQLTSFAGCDSVVTLNLSVNPVYSLDFEASVCQGSSYSFENTNYTTAGVYTHYYQTAAGCDSVRTLTLTITPPITISTNVNICQGQSYTFEGQSYSSPGTYIASYTDVNGCDSLMVLNLTVTTNAPEHVYVDICQGETYSFNGQNYSSNGVYTANLQTPSGCDSTAVLHLTVHQNYAVNQNVSICEGQVYTFGGLPYTQTGVYVLELQSAFGCDSIITLNLTVNPIPVVNIGDLFEICEGETQVLSNSVPASNFNWSNQSTAPTITVSSSGIYKLIVNGVGNCIGIDSAQVIVHPLPGGLTDAQWTICDGEEIVINGGNPANSYEWSNGETSPEVTFDQSGNYTVKITSPFGCISNFSFEIGYFCEPVVFVPNSFTPNNDGVNDVFMVYGEFIAEMNLSIFNRWGERIFQTTDVNPVWTGDVHDGEHYAQDGHYNWVMRYKVYSDAFGNISDWKEMVGTVFIVR